MPQHLSLHQKLISLVEHLGYENKGFSKGLCHGFSIKWLEANLLNEEMVFNTRIKKILAFSKSDLKHNDLGVRAFFESLLLYHRPSISFDLFGCHTNQHNVDFISTLAASDAIQVVGGLKTLLLPLKICNQNELGVYLKQIADELEEVYKGELSTIGIRLANVNHVIALSYQTRTERWQAMDINQWPSLEGDIKHITEYVYKGFFQAYKTDAPYITFSTQLIITGKQLKLNPALNNLSKRFDYELTPAHIARSPNGSFTYIAAFMGLAEMIPILSKLGDDLNKVMQYGSTPLSMAAQDGHLDTIRALAKAGADVNKSNRFGVTSIFIAAQNGHADAINILAEAGADANKARNDGVTPTYIAAHHGHVAVIEALAEAGADLNKVTNKGHSPALIAAQNGHTAVINVLIEAGADLNKTTNDGYGPAFAAAHNGHAAVIKALAEAGVDLNFAANDGFTPALIAAQNGHASVIKALIEAGVDLNQTTDNGLSPALIAAQNGHVAVIKALIEVGVDLNIAANDGFTPAMIAAQNGHASVIKVLIEAGVDLNQTTDNGFTPGMIAAQNGHASVIKALAEAGADLNIAANNGFTSALIAAQNGHAAVINLLAEAGADLNTTTNYGFTPALIAAQNGHVNVIKALAEAGADLNKTTETGCTPVFMAAQKGHIELIQLLTAFEVRLHAPFQRKVHFLNEFIKKYELAVQERMSQFLSTQKTETVDMFPIQIAYIMGHDEVLSMLFEHLSLKEKGEFLASINPNTTAEKCSLSLLLQEKEKKSYPDDKKIWDYARKNAFFGIFSTVQQRQTSHMLSICLENSIKDVFASADKGALPKERPQSGNIKR